MDTRSKMLTVDAALRLSHGSLRLIAGGFLGVPTGPLARVIREHAGSSPCLLRECPIDHRCMTRVTTDRVVAGSFLGVSTVTVFGANDDTTTGPLARVIRGHVESSPCLTRVTTERVVAAASELLHGHS
jgi:hypothetical protein